jgi:hypothetical protein
MNEVFLSTDSVINVIEQDISGRPSVMQPSGDQGREGAESREGYQRLDAAALDAVAAQRQRQFDAARARLRDQASRDAAQATRQLGVHSTADAPPDTPNKPDNQASNKALHKATHAPLAQPPERVRKRYLRADNQYFLKDAPYQLAFEDLGPYLVTEHNRPDVVESMVDMAAAKSWGRIRVSGHDVFRREVWVQGTLLGIEVSGYAPKAADLARLADARQVRLNNRIEAETPTRTNDNRTPAPASGFKGGTSMHLFETLASAENNRASSPAFGFKAGASMPLVETPAHANDNPIPARASEFRAETPGPAGGASRIAASRAQEAALMHPPERAQIASDEPDSPRRYAGELRDHGGAPYQNNPARSDSYYVVFRDAAGIDQVVWGVDLERAMRASRAELGEPITLENLGRRLVTITAPIFDEHGRVVGEEEKTVYRNTWQVEVAPRERSTAEYGARAEGVANMTAEAANTSTRDHQQAHRHSVVSDEDKVMHLAVLAGAMREQGFSARSIARVQQRAQALLDAFSREGVSVPRPRAFDLKAPAERDRQARSAASQGRAPAREIERDPVELSPSR